MRKKDVNNTLKTPVKESGTAADHKEKQTGPDKTQRIVKALENARKFYKKNDRGGGVDMDTIIYLAQKHNNDLVQGFDDIFSIAYRYGYQQAQRDAKRKDNSK
jgi:hypothetical protein